MISTVKPESTAEATEERGRTYQGVVALLRASGRLLPHDTIITKATAECGYRQICRKTMSAIVTIAKDLPDGQIAVPTAVLRHSGRPTAMWTYGEQLSALERRRAHDESKGMESLTHWRVREVRRPDYIKMSSAPSELIWELRTPPAWLYLSTTMGSSKASCTVGRVELAPSGRTRTCNLFFYSRFFGDLL